MKLPDFDRVDSPPVDLTKLPRNNAVNKFWASVDPYCSDITPENIKFLEELLRSHEDDSEYLKVPPLGMHYTEKWAEEDMLEEQRQGMMIVCIWLIYQLLFFYYLEILYNITYVFLWF